MSKQLNRDLSRAISVADYILEDDGHSIAEAAKEFRYCRSTIERDINYLGSVAFYGNDPNSQELKLKYIKVRKTLNKLAKQNYSNSIAKRNAQKKATSD